MANKSIYSRIIHTHDTEANWLTSHFIPAQGELIIYDVDATHPNPRYKIGDGLTGINQLPFQNTNAIIATGGGEAKFDDIFGGPPYVIEFDADSLEVPDGFSASDAIYANNDSGLAANNVQDAIDELAQEKQEVIRGNQNQIVSFTTTGEAIAKSLDDAPVAAKEHTHTAPDVKGGVFGGAVYAQNNDKYTIPQLRNISFDEEQTDGVGYDGNVNFVLDTVGSTTKIVGIQVCEDGIWYNSNFESKVIPTSIDVTTMPAKTTYQYKEYFSTDGMVVTVTYSNGTTKPTTNYFIAFDPLTQIGDNQINISYSENGIDLVTAIHITVIKKKVPKPALIEESKNLVYNGEAQSPVWQNYDIEAMVMVGSNSATNAGNYTTTFDLKNQYQWEDETEDDAVLSWSIAKATGSLTVDQTSLNLTNSNNIGWIDVNIVGDGTISASSSDSDIATVAVHEIEIPPAVVVTAVGSGSATITINVAEGTNYLAPASQIVNVSVVLNATASTSATSGVTYTSGIFTLSQEKLNEYAKAISNNVSITNETSEVYIDDGSEHYKISVGDEVTIPYGTVTRDASSSDGDEGDYIFNIIGFNHDDLAESATAYGETTVTGKAGISFQMKDCLKTTYKMNSTSTNSGGWGGCAFRTTLQSIINGRLPSAWQNIIKTIIKKTRVGGLSPTINSYSDTIFLLAEIEIFGLATNSVEGEGDQYAWYKAGNSKIKKVNNSAYGWWGRSPKVNSSNAFFNVSNDGNSSANYADTSYGIAFGFCV